MKWFNKQTRLTKFGISFALLFFIIAIPVISVLAGVRFLEVSEAQATPTSAPQVALSTEIPFESTNFAKEAERVCTKTYPKWFHSGSAKYSLIVPYHWDQWTNTWKFRITYYPNGSIDLGGIKYNYYFDKAGNEAYRMDHVKVTPEESAEVFKELSSQTIGILQVEITVYDKNGSFVWDEPACLPITQ